MLAVLDVTDMGIGHANQCGKVLLLDLVRFAVFSEHGWHVALKKMYGQPVISVDNEVRQCLNERNEHEDAMAASLAQQIDAALPGVRAKRTALLADVHAAQAAGDTDAYGDALARLNAWIDGLGSGPVAHPTANSGRWQQPSGGYLYGWTLGD